MTVDDSVRESVPRVRGASDVRADAAWNRLTWLSAQLLDAPMCIATFSSDGAVAAVGTWGIPPTAIPILEASVAIPPLAALLTAGKPFIVEDAEREHDSQRRAAVRSLGGIAAIAVPIPARDGHVAGTLSVIDTKPRVWNVRDGAILAELGELVASEIELRRELERLRPTSAPPVFPAPVPQAAAPESMTSHDTLTGLPTRLLLYDRLRQILALARRYGEVLAVLYLDLDGIGAINAEHGNQIGDLALAHAANRIASVVRESDTVARLGDDQFMIVLARVGSLENAAAVANKLLGSLQGPVELSGRTVELTATIGIATYPEDGQEAATLLHMAEAAVHKAKALGDRVFPVNLSQVGLTAKS